MPDIDITCGKCTAVTTLSEFVDDSKLICRACGEKLVRPGVLAAALAAQRSQATPADAPPPTTSRLRLAKKEREYTAPTEEGEEPLKAIVDTPATQGQDGPLNLRPEIKEEKRVNHAAIAGGLFVVLAGIMGYLRYGGILRPDILAMSAEYAWIVAMAFHAMIVIKALTDNMMQGILCLLVPGYSLFYLFTVSDDFYMRAVLAGLLAGIGQDAAIKLNYHATNIAQVVHGFIAGGGGDIR
jgi:hypothetical protein